MIYTLFQNSINWFIPESFRKKELSNRLMRAKVLIVMLLWSFLSTSLIGCGLNLM